MSNGDRERRIFLSHPHTNNGFFFLLTTKYHILNWKNHEMTSRRAAVCFYLSLGMVRVCEMSKTTEHRSGVRESLVPNSVTTIFGFSLIGRRETIRKTERCK